VAIMAVLLDWWYEGRVLTTRMLQVESEDGSKVTVTSEGFDAPTMLFYDSNGRVRMESGLARNGSPYLRLLGEDGGRVIVMDTLTESGAPQFFMQDPNDSEVGWRAVLDASSP